MWQFLKDLEPEIPFDPAVPLLGIYTHSTIKTYVHECLQHCSQQQRLESTQMPISDSLDKENVAHIHHGILCSHKKGCIHVLYKDMDEAGNHHSQQTNTRTENQTPHKWVSNNENT